HTIPQSMWTISINEKSIENDDELEDDLVNTDQCEEDKREKYNGWALKGNQKLGNRNSGSRIKKNIKDLLKYFFLNSNRRSQDKMDDQAMHDKLLKYAKASEIEKENILQTTTIRNWLFSYS
ncbi:2233_t:CDS:2, partial [Racocetra persica]